MTILWSGLQYVRMPKPGPLVITEAIIYIVHSAHGWSLDGSGAVTPSVAWLKDLFGGLCCRSCTAHTVGTLLCLPNLCHRFYYNLYIRDCNVDHCMQEKQKVLLSWWGKLVLPTHLMDYSPRKTDFIFSETHVVFPSHHSIERVKVVRVIFLGNSE